MRRLFARGLAAGYTLRAGTAVSGFSRPASEIRVTRGQVWVTIEGIGRDYWLSAGERLAVAPGRLVVIEADKEDSRVEVGNEDIPQAGRTAPLAPTSVHAQGCACPAT